MRISALGLFLFASLASPTIAEEANTPRSPATIRIEDSPAVVTIWDITDQNQITRVRQAFQNELSRLGSAGHISSCDRIVAVSRIEQAGKVIAGRDLSYGASCSVQIGNRQLSLLMCDFPMTGKFTLTETGSNTLEWFASFIRTNCPAGG